MYSARYTFYTMPLWTWMLYGKSGQMKDKPRKRASQSLWGNGPQRQWQAEVRQLRQGRTRNEEELRERRIPPIHTWDLVGGRLYNDSTESLGRRVAAV